MRVVLDACVLFPTVLRELLLATAAAGHLTPLYSARILEEWRRAALRTGGAAVGATAGVEIALMRSAWPMGEITAPPGAEDSLSLPDDNDRHVLATALAGGAERLITANLRDFPSRTLARHGIIPQHPDALMTELYHADPTGITALTDALLARTNALSQAPMTRRALLKRSTLPRLAKAIDRAPPPH